MPKRTTVPVTVAVDLDDIRDVLAFHRKDTNRVPSDFNARALRRYAELDPQLRDAFLMQLPPSLGWCIDEIERNGITAIEQLLIEHGQTAERIDS